MRSGFAEAQVCRLHALIPLEVFNIDHLNQKTPAQLKHLKDGLAVTEAMQQLRRPNYWQKKEGETRWQQLGCRSVNTHNDVLVLGF